MTASAAEHRRGMGFGTGAYLVWGVFPLYFLLLVPAGAFEVLVHRILWTLVFCTLLLTVTRTWRDVVPLLREPRRLLLLGAAAVVIAVNWVVYIYGVTTERVVEASLGYFINPLVTVLLGVLVLRERLRPLQWAAVGIGAAAVAGLTVDYGRLPWISVVLAVSFGSYGLLKNRVGRGTGALASLTAETALLAPLALVALAWLTASGRSTFTLDPPGHALLLASTGVATALPLLMFAAAARRIPLSTIGLLQYLTPVLQFLCGVVLLGERMPPSRWVGFAAVWLALVVLSVDAVRAARGRSREARSAAAPAAVPA